MFPLPRAALLPKTCSGVAAACRSGGCCRRVALRADTLPPRSVSRSSFLKKWPAAAGACFSSKAPSLSVKGVEGVRSADMVIAFTCRKCETRSVRGLTRNAYEKGVVIIRCGGCDSLHLIADNLGYFKDGLGGGGKNVEDFLRDQGEHAARYSATLEFVPDAETATDDSERR